MWFSELQVSCWTALPSALSAALALGRDRTDLMLETGLMAWKPELLPIDVKLQSWPVAPVKPLSTTGVLSAGSDFETESALPVNLLITLYCLGLTCTIDQRWPERPP